MADTGWKLPTSLESNSGWINPANMQVEDGSNAVAVGSSDVVQYNFGLVVPPSSVIDGIEVGMKCYGSGSFTQVNNELKYNSRASTAPQVKGGNLPVSPLTWIYRGGATDKWGRTWAPSDFSNTNFGIRVVTAIFSGIGYIDALRVRVFYTLAGWAGASIDGYLPSSIASVNSKPLSAISEIDGVS